MSKKKGLSIEEKIIKCEEYFHEHQVPFTLKELMVLIPKAKGVIYQSVEECIELLVSENRVQCEKIGVSTFYWYFEVSSMDKAAAKCDILKHQKSALLHQVTDKTKQCAQSWSYLGVEEAFSADINPQTSPSLLSLENQRLQLSQLTHQISTRRHQIGALADRDPNITQRLSEIRGYARAAVNRWTDNLFLVEDAICKSTSFTRGQLRANFGTPPQIDYIPTTDDGDLLCNGHRH